MIFSRELFLIHLKFICIHVTIWVLSHCLKWDYKPSKLERSSLDFPVSMLAESLLRVEGNNGCCNIVLDWEFCVVTTEKMAMYTLVDYNNDDDEHKSLLNPTEIMISANTCRNIFFLLRCT